LALYSYVTVSVKMTCCLIETAGEYCQKSLLHSAR